MFINKDNVLSFKNGGVGFRRNEKNFTLETQDFDFSEHQLKFVSKNP